MPNVGWGGFGASEEPSPNVIVPVRFFLWNVMTRTFSLLLFYIFQYIILNWRYIHGVQNSKSIYKAMKWMLLVSLPHHSTFPGQLALTAAVCTSRGKACPWSLAEALCSLGFNLASRGAATDGHRTEPPVCEPDPCIFHYPYVEESSQAKSFTWKSSIWGVWLVIFAATLQISPTKHLRWECPYWFVPVKESLSKKLLGQDPPGWDHGEGSLEYWK